MQEILLDTEHTDHAMKYTCSCALAHRGEGDSWNSHDCGDAWRCYKSDDSRYPDHKYSFKFCSYAPNMTHKCPMVIYNQTPLERMAEET